MSDLSSPALSNELQLEINRLEAKLAHLYEAEAEIAEERDETQRKLALLRLLADQLDQQPTPSLPTGPREPRLPSPPRSLEGMSLSDATAAILREADSPLHVSVIEQRLKAGGYAFSGLSPRNSITAALLRDPRFRRVQPATYAVADPRDAWDETFWTSVVHLLLKAEHQLPWVGLKHFRDMWLPQVLGSADSPSLRGAVIREGISQGIIITHEVTNPGSEFATTALKANESSEIYGAAMSRGSEED